MAQIKPTLLNELPIEIGSVKTRNTIEIIVKRIIQAKKADPKADTGALEAEIDRLVYELYGLTEEEIAIIENSQ